MAKTGRNDPCPCGSGKKYKKCCLAKEQQQSTAARGSSAGRRRDETDDLFEGLPAVPAGNMDEDMAVEADIAPRPELDAEPFVSNSIDHDLPDISQEEHAIVDGWWKVYKGLKDPDAIIRHLNG